MGCADREEVSSLQKVIVDLVECFGSVQKAKLPFWMSGLRDSAPLLSSELPNLTVITMAMTLVSFLVQVARSAASGC